MRSISSTVPANTQIINVTSDKGVCYVNLNQTFFSRKVNYWKEGYALWLPLDTTVTALCGST